MTRFMHTASALTLATVLAAAPVVATAQEATEQDAEQATEEMAQEAEEATEDAAQEAEEAAEETGEAVEEAGEEAAQAAEEATDEAAEATEDAAQATEEAAEEVTEEAPAEGEMAQEAPATQEGEMAGAEEPVDPPEGTITLQDEDSILVSELMGATLYNSADETVGDVNDAIVSLDGTVEGVVIGVGGFLGIGEKRVAVELQQISVQTDEDGDPRLIIDATRESLEAAPEFVTAQEQRQEQEAQQMQQQSDTGMGGTEPVGDATAPAD